MRKWLYRILGFLIFGLAAISVLVVGGYWWLTTSVSDYNDSVELDGLTATVEVIRDQRTIPHIFASSSEDAFFALGYIHAQDRLWQMEMIRRLGQGRVAEIAGEAGVGIDKLIRTLDFYRLAEQTVDLLAPDSRAVLMSYSAGVNAYLEARGGSLPPDFLVAGVDPEPWRPADSIVWGKLMTLQLSGNWFKERLRLLLSGHLDAAQLRDLWPDNSKNSPTTLTSLSDLHREVAALAGTAPLPALAGAPGFSNEWVVDGDRTATGFPLLANDPHLGYQAPNLWYLARLEAPGLSVVGATVPGVPIVLLGHNNHIAWGLTTTESDVSDLFIERVVPEAPDMYETPRGPMRFETREEIIEVRGGDPITWTVRSSRHGPVVSDLWVDDGQLPIGDNVLALKAAFLQPGDLTAQAMLRLNRAIGWKPALEALRDYAVPQQNFVYADIAGNIGIITPGLVPIRRRGDGWLPVPGWTDDYAWDGYIPYDQLPQSFNPSSGRIVNANNAIVPPSYPYFLGRDWENKYRAERIDELLDGAGPYDTNLFIDMQADNLSGAARQLLPLMLAPKALGDRADGARALLSNWDYSMFRDQAEPLIFTAWLRELNRALYADELGDLFESYWGLRAEVVFHILSDAGQWCDDITTAGTEDCDSRIALALDRAIARLAAEYGDDPLEWFWAIPHRAEFKNRVLDVIPLIRDLANLAIAVDGGTYTINRNSSSIGNDKAPFAAVHGAGYRAIYDLSDLSQSLFIQATGQSGNPLSPFYDSFLVSWRDFRYLKIAGDRDSLAADALGVLTLTSKP
ncbi:MAG: penicillin acylase family protein [Alphaproteobacteria bacterium]|nr:penicillin acylase family protein [Alphaproteobacteria bacterium]